MSFYTRIRNGMSNVDEADLQGVQEDFIESAGVVHLATDLIVSQNGIGDRSVNISAGIAYILNNAWANAQNLVKYPQFINSAVFNTASTNPATSSVLNFAINTSGNPRIDLVVIRYAPGATVDANGSGVCYPDIVQGTAASSPVAPAVPANCLVLAQVTLANNYTQILTANITDKRTIAYIRSLVPYNTSYKALSQYGFEKNVIKYNTSNHAEIGEFDSPIDLPIQTGTPGTPPTTPATGMVGFYVDGNKVPSIITTSGNVSNFEMANFKDRQGFINGNFDRWERGSSLASSTVGSTLNRYGHLADRFFFQATAGGGATGDYTFTISQQAFTLGQTAVPNEPTYFHRYALTGLATLGTNTGLFRTSQRIEDVRTYAGKKMTVSMWVKADTARTMAICAIQYFGSGGSPSSIVSLSGGTTISVTTSWQKFTTTFTVPSIAGKTLGTDGKHFLEVGLVYYKQDDVVYAIPSGTVGTHATGAFDTAQWKVNVGDIELPFIGKSPAQELVDCERFCRVRSFYGVAFNTNDLMAVYNWGTPMRGTPSITFYASNDASGTPARLNRYGTGPVDVSALTGGDGNKYGGTYFSKTGSFVAGATYLGSLLADAEF